MQAFRIHVLLIQDACNSSEHGRWASHINVAQTDKYACLVSAAHPRMWKVILPSLCGELAMNDARPPMGASPWDTVPRLGKLWIGHRVFLVGYVPARFSTPLS